MAKKRDEYLRTLDKDARRWVAKGLIEETQRLGILAEVRDFAGVGESDEEGKKRTRRSSSSPTTETLASSPKKSMVGWLPMIMVGIATLLLAVGILLFYAANWRYMSTTLKLAQIFVLLVGLYGGAFYGLAIKGSQLFGRAFLFLGVVAFGAAIGLIAQVFHISAHPSNGVLLWAIVAASMAWLLRDVAIAYLCALLVLIWNLWEVTVYMQPNYFFAFAILGLLALFLRCGSRLGLVFVVVFGLLLFGQANAHALLILQHLNEYQVYPLLLSLGLLCLPVGLLCLALARFVERWEIASWAQSALVSLGLLLSWGALIGVSWPLRFDVMYPHLSSHGHFLTIQYIAFLAAAALLSMYAENTSGRKASALFSSMMIFSIVLFLLPLGDKRILLVASHLGLLLVVFAGLGSFYLDAQSTKVERFFGWSVADLTLLIKMVAFFVLGLESRRFYIAYVLGFVIFGVVFFLCNLLLRHLLQKEKIDFPTQHLQSWGVLLSYVSFYALSFKITYEQKSIFSASPFVLTLLIFFVSVASILFVYLISQASQKLPVALCGAIFLATCFGLFSSGPQWSWVAYSLYFNAILFLMVALLLFYSVKINSVNLVYFALSGLILQVVTRYFDVLWELISGSLLFIVTGLLVMIGGYLLNKQRLLLVEVIESSRQGQGQQVGGGQ